MGCDPQQHLQHMCMLNAEGKTEAVRFLSARPFYRCTLCEARANREENLCDPEGLERGEAEG